MFMEMRKTAISVVKVRWNMLHLFSILEQYKSTSVFVSETSHYSQSQQVGKIGNLHWSLNGRLVRAEWFWKQKKRKENKNKNVHHH